MRLSVLPFLLLFSTPLNGFPLHVRNTRATTTAVQQRLDGLTTALSRLTTKTTTFRIASTTKDVSDIKHDIEELRQEALRRLDALNHKVEELSLTNESSSAEATFTKTPTLPEEDEEEEEDEVMVANTLVANPPPPPPSSEEVDSTILSQEINEVEPVLNQRLILADDAMEEKVVPNTKITQNDDNNDSRIRRPAVAPTPKSARLSQMDDLNLLDGTRWKVMLNIGREPGTWMPKTWGASGERLLLNLEIQFTPNQLYEREDFLNGMAGAKELVVSELTTAPSMSEGSRQVPVKSIGGWRIARGEGPAGTDLLRFYVEVQDEVRHRGSDVSCPAGRVYFTCGYFPLTHRDSKAPSLKDMLREEHDAIVAKYEEVSKEMNEDTSLISWDRMKRTKELMDLRVLAGKVARQIEEAKMREPEKASLRLSKKRDVGLTQEGGLCCKVIKGMTMEYHILGKFGVACIDHRDHSNLHP